MIEMTDAAKARVKELLNDETGSRLRMFVQSGGCSGFEYGMAFDDVREGDEVLEMEGFTLLIDQESAPALSGVKVDFVESLTGSGFTFVNPNARSSCGCGHSFSA
jgi:iron-sulfur cluster assembly accessory protein